MRIVDKPRVAHIMKHCCGQARTKLTRRQRSSSKWRSSMLILGGWRSTDAERRRRDECRKLQFNIEEPRSHDYHHPAHRQRRIQDLADSPSAHIRLVNIVRSSTHFNLVDDISCSAKYLRSCRATGDGVVDSLEFKKLENPSSKNTEEQTPRGKRGRSFFALGRGQK